MRPPADEIGILEDYGHDFSGPVPPSIWVRIAAKDPHEYVAKWALYNLQKCIDRFIQ